MRSSSSEHFIALDHIRAIAALLVFSWHFMHGATGTPVPFDFVPRSPVLAVFDEGHTGVSLFMVLSGYLFAKLLEGKQIDYPLFLWNRAVRLLPLLIFVLALGALRTVFAGQSLPEYLWTIAQGAIYPTLPYGGWSITVELHFYLVLPLLLWLLRRSRWLPLLVIASALTFRAWYFHEHGEVQSLSYWTIVGRIDQFVAGVLLFSFRNVFAGKHLRAMAILVLFCVFYQYLNSQGGFYAFRGYPSTSPLWIFLPTIEGLSYAVGVAWYDTSFSLSRTGISAFIGRLGTYSYSIYLFHWFFVFHLARTIHARVLDLSNFYVAFVVSLLCYLASLSLGYLSFRFIEAPFLRLRKRYATVIESPVPEAVLT